MCMGIEYLVNGEAEMVDLEAGAKLPIRMRNGTVRFHRWGSTTGLYLDDNTPGWMGKFPNGTHASLESIQAGEWLSYDPAPVKIVASRFLMISRWHVPRHFPLGRGEYIQGLLANVLRFRRVYVVTVPTPGEYADDFPDGYPGWPRIVSAPRKPGPV
jgi:hypothetical protein